MCLGTFSVLCHRTLLGFYFSEVPVSFRVLWLPADFILVNECDGLVLHSGTPCWSSCEAGLGLILKMPSQDIFSKVY